MAKETKALTSFEESLGLLDIRLGKIIDAQLCTTTAKPTYKMTIDFGKFGRKTSYGRFTMHPLEEVVGRQVLAVLNFPPRTMGEVVSEALVLGVQYPKAESGEATFISPVTTAKIGSKVF